MKRVLIILALFIGIIDLLLLGGWLYNNFVNNAPLPIKPVKNNNYYYRVFLTSDDGPLAMSKNLNRVILEERVPFTLFLVGKPASINKNLLKELALYKKNPYISLCNHSFSHANFHYIKYYQDPDNVLDDFLKNRDFLELECNLARLPGRNIWRIGSISEGEKSGSRAANLLALNGFDIVGWDIEWHMDRRGKILESPKEIYHKILDALYKDKTHSNGDLVLLMHDQMFRTKEDMNKLKELIKLLKSNSFIKLASLKEYNSKKE
ncbi:MAG: polysaccharide deacetylase family protein [Epsilonproteobacteria bacterium]|nr:polysaccharide deacetylase family protein [Campylobacterota bacterium]